MAVFFTTYLQNKYSIYEKPILYPYSTKHYATSGTRNQSTIYFYRYIYTYTHSLEMPVLQHSGVNWRGMYTHSKLYTSLCGESHVVWRHVSSTGNGALKTKFVILGTNPPVGQTPHATLKFKCLKAPIVYKDLKQDASKKKKVICMSSSMWLHSFRFVTRRLSLWLLLVFFQS